MLVAGGLGERLGYSGIKIALPTELASGKCFLQVSPLHLTCTPHSLHNLTLFMKVMEKQGASDLLPK